MLVRALSSSEALLPENLHEAIEGLSAEGFRRRTTQATHKAKSKLGKGSKNTAKGQQGKGKEGYSNYNRAPARWTARR